MAAKKSLIIVESPAKTRTIKNYLGDDYEIMASMGHVRDLPENGLGVDLEHHFSPEYVTIKDKVDILAKLRKAVQHAKMVYLATDPDREGEAIAWHLREALDLDDAERIEFNEITKNAIVNALEHPRTINMSRVNAQQARRVLDRLVGYQLSPLLWRKVRRGLSAGRVQSVAVKLVCDREREISAFDPEEYWTITAELLPQGDETSPFLAKLIARDGQKIKLTNADEAHSAERDLQAAKYSVDTVKVSDQRRNPQPPFITSTLQQEASRTYGYSAKRTMALAQQLYEGLDMGEEGHVGLITYMRTDSTRISVEATEQAAAYIAKNFGSEYLPKTERKTKAVKGAQEAHEAIRPTDVTRSPEFLAKHLNPDQLKLYRLIWRRFMASQMASAILEVMVVDVAAGNYTLRANGQRVKFPGYLSLSPDRQESEFLPPVREGDPLERKGDLQTEQHFTQPPARYTEATLIKAMEARGIGRPSTYAPTISTILDRRYVFLEAKKFHPTGLGMVVTEQLEKHFSDIIDPDFTAHVEDDLDSVESGTEEWVEVLDKFYGPFEKALSEATETMQRIKVPEVALEQTCPKCGKQLALKEGRFGRFVACTGFPECDFTAQEDQFLKSNDEEHGEGEKAEEQPEVLCDQCGAPMVVRHSRRGPFLGCSKYPECTNTQPMPGKDGAVVQKKEPAPWTNIPCEKCGRPMAIRSGKRGQFLGCSGFPRCRSIKKMPEEGTYEIVPRPEPEPKAAKTTKTTKKTTTRKRTTKTKATEETVQE
ncbi:MAG TPA: type I DNA topoisomerase [Armatimonadota bacterium]|nr:type I DNA topoisomerase [Armatimonadota bacterium]